MWKLLDCYFKRSFCKQANLLQNTTVLLYYENSVCKFQYSSL